MRSCGDDRGCRSTTGLEGAIAETLERLDALSTAGRDDITARQRGGDRGSPAGR